MSEVLNSVLGVERSVFDEAMQRIGFPAGLVAFSMSDRAASGHNVVPVPLLALPVDFAGLLLERDLGTELLATAARESADLLRAGGPSVLLGAALCVLESTLRLRVPAEERLEMAIEAVHCFSEQEAPRLRGRCLANLGTILRDSGSAYDALIAYDKAEPYLSRCEDAVGLSAVAYHRAVIARSVSAFEAGLVYLEGAGDALDGAGEDLADGVASERAICLFESGNVEAASSAVENWLETSVTRAEMSMFNQAMPYSMRSRIRLQQGNLEGALDDIVRSAQLAAGSVGQYTTRQFRTTDRAQLQPLFAEALRLALGQERGDVAVDVLAFQKSIKPGRLRPMALEGLSEFAGASLKQLMAEVALVAADATNATIFRDLGRMSRLSESAGHVLDRADVLAGPHRRPGVASTFNTSGAADRVMQWLLPDELVVEYAAVGGFLFAIAIRADRVDTFPIRILDLDAAVLNACAVAERVARRTPRALNRLGTALLDPLADLITKARRVYFVLPEDLQAFPMHAVEFDGRPLVMSLDVVYVPSVEFLGQQTGSHEADLTPHIFSVSHPRYEDLEPLRWAAEDAARVAAHLGRARMSLDDEATATALLDGIKQAGLLHVTAHAAFEPRAPMVARLMMADRPVFAFEIAMVQAAASAINLSGCSTASQRTSLGGEGIGLAAAFLSAGVSAVVASWWPVEDEVAAAFNDAFYEHLASSPQRTDVWAATNAAQRSLLLRDEWRHPSTWAPFVALGSPTREVS